LGVSSGVPLRVHLGFVQVLFSGLVWVCSGFAWGCSGFVWVCLGFVLSFCGVLSGFVSGLFWDSFGGWFSAHLGLGMC
jgi:hypothetical protein